MKKLLIAITLIAIVGQVSALPWVKTNEKKVVTHLKNAIKSLQEAQGLASKSDETYNQDFYNALLDAREAIQNRAMVDARRIRHAQKFGYDDAGLEAGGKNLTLRNNQRWQDDVRSYERELEDEVDEDWDV